MQFNIENINRQAWFAIAAMLVIYLILVLEDVVEALRKRTVLVMKVYEENPPMKVIDNEPSIDWSKVSMEGATTDLKEDN
jgi:hypothetical protein